MVNVIGIDIGGTKIKAGIMNNQGQILSLLEEKTNKEGLVEQLLNLINQLSIKNTYPIEAIGIATAGRVRFKEGSISFATPNLPGWTGTEVKQIVEERFHVPTVVDNDANCAAYAEKILGSAKGYENIICITLGTGVGSGIIINNQLVRGKDGGAGEIGHMTFIPDGKPCNCGKKGCWEQYVSGTALRREIESKDVLKNVTPEQLFKLAHQSNQSAKKIVDRFIRHLAIGISSLQNILEMDCLVLGGGIIDSSDYWWDHFIDEVKTMIRNPFEIRKAILKNNAGMIGAAQMAVKIVENQESIR